MRAVFPALLLLAAAGADAAVVLTLDQTSISGTPGTLVTLTGSILNESPTGEALVNLASTNLTGAGATVSQVFAPDNLAYGATYTGNLLEVMISGASPGLYPATLSFSFDDFNGRTVTSTQAGFSAEVLPEAAVPEPVTLPLVLAGSAAVLCWRRRQAS